MTDLLKKTSNDYGIWVDQIESEVRATHNGVLLAKSTNAKVMYETRLPPVIYFPTKDVLHGLGEVSDLKTFCPFKGTASYFDLMIKDEQLPNAAWCYKNALIESKGVEGHIAFARNIETDFKLSDAFQSPGSGNISSPTVDWILREAWLCKSPQELTAQIARKLVSDGIAICRISVMIWSLHPQIAGKNYIWTKETDTVETHSLSYDIHTHPSFINSPLRHVSNGLGGVRQRLDEENLEFDFPIIRELQAQGATDYVAMPLPFSNGQTNVLTLTCDHPQGFTTPNLGLVFESSAVLSRYYEVFALKENAQSLLETYLGKRTGKRVLGGEIRRGDGDEIDAAILFCDLRGSTRLETSLGREAYIELLNRFFEETTDIINAHGGEVLKFIGDAVLAIFPADGDQEMACGQAMTSATEIVEKISKPTKASTESAVDCAIGIAYGAVTYGNVGSRERLDFTVIGQAANIAARLGDYGKTINHRIIVTKEIATATSHAILLGSVELHNVSRPIEAFAVNSGQN